MHTMRSMPTLVILCGMPGSGKSHYRRANYATTKHFSLDGQRANGWGGGIERLLRAAPRCLAEGDLVIDLTSLLAEHRAAWADVARRCGARTRVVVFTTAPEVCAFRNSRRTADRRVPDSRMQFAARLHRRLPAVVAREGFDEVVFVDGV